MYLPKLFRTLGWSLSSVAIVPAAIGVYGAIAGKEFVFGLNEERFVIAMAGFFLLGGFLLQLEVLLEKYPKYTLKEWGN